MNFRLPCFPEEPRGVRSVTPILKPPAFHLQSGRCSLVHALCLTGLLLALLLGMNVLANGTNSTEELHQSETARESAKVPSVRTNSGPEALKQKVRIVVDTNAPPASGETNATPAKKSSFEWKFAWDGWDGLYVGISKKKPFHLQTPRIFTDALLTNAFSWIHLEEQKMEGHIGARVAVDGAGFVTTGDLDGFDGGVQLRRFRLCTKGNCILILPVSYELEVGYVPGGFYIEDSYLAFENLGFLGELKFGQFQPPMSLEALASSRDITFMESAAPVQALAPGVNAGLQFRNSIFKERATWALGLFSEGLGQDTGDASSDYARAIARITFLPWYRMTENEPSSQHLLHLGVSGNILYSASSNVRYESRPESHIAPVVIDTEDIDASRAAVVDFEAAWVNGPLSVQGEFLNSFVNEESGSSLHFYGFYGYASWFLTGESRPYDRRSGTFTRLHPKSDFSFKGSGLGAWEVAGRASYTDLNDGDISGGRMTLLTGGVTWYPHSHIRWKFNYVHGRVEGRDPSGKINVFETRVEVDF